jgi:O-antigen ligase
VLLGRRAWEAAEVPWAALSPLALALLLFGHGLAGRSPYFGSALSAALYLVWASLLIVAARALLRECGAARLCTAMAAGIAGGALASARVGVLQHLQWPTLLDHVVLRTSGAAIFGNLAQANHFATYTVLGLLSLAWLHARGRAGPAMTAAAALPMLFVLGLSGSRAAALYLLAAFALAAWARSREPDKAATRLLWLTGLYLAAYFLMQVAVEAGMFRHDGRQSVTALERFTTATASIADRIRLWQAAWLLFTEHPLAGAGWGMFGLRFFEMSAAHFPDAAYRLYQNPHNLFLHLLAETGLVGLVCVALPLAIALWPAAGPAGPRPERWLVPALAAALLLHSLLEYPLWYAYFLGIAALLLGMLPLRTRRLRLGARWRWIVAAALCTATFNLASVWLDYRGFEAVFRAGGNVDRRELPGLMMRLHRNPLLRPYVEVATAFSISLDEASLDRQLYVNSRALRYVPEVSLVYRQVLLLALADRLPEAQRLLAQARHAYPVPPPEYPEDLARLAASQPARIRPLLESAPLRAGGQP